MKLTRDRKFTVNMGNYESLVIGASVEIDTTASGYDQLTLAELEVLLNAQLDSILESEVKEARELTSIKDSYILSYRN